MVFVTSYVCLTSINYNENSGFGQKALYIVLLLLSYYHSGSLSQLPVAPVRRQNHL